MTAILTAILPVLLSLLEQTPAIVTEVENAIAWLTGQGASPTAEQQSAIDAALDAAHAKLQAS